MSGFEPLAFTALRVVGGFLFVAHGLQKLGLIGEQGMVNLGSLLGAAAILETIGGPLIMLGLFTIPTAIVLSGEMAIAYFRVHSPIGPWPVENGGELALLYLFLFLFIASRGPGRWSLDYRRRSHRHI